MVARPRPKAIEYLDHLQSSGRHQSKRKYEDALQTVLARPEADWVLAATAQGLRYGPELHRRLKLLQSEQFEERDRELRDHAPRYQSLVDYRIMRDTKAAFDDLIKTRFRNPDLYRVSDRVYFGTLEVDVVNALITPVPESDEFLILINRALWEGAKLLSYVLAGTLFSNPHGLGAEIDPRATDPFTRAFLTHFPAILRGGPGNEGWPIPEKGSTLDVTWLLLDQAMHDFIMGHEYGHFLRGHFDGQCERVVRRVGDRDIRLNTTGWHNEYDADRVGIDLAVMRAKEQMLRASDAEGPELDPAVGMSMITTCLGCWACLHLFWRLEQTRDTVFRVDSSHPPSPLRINAMYWTILSQIPDPGMKKYVADSLRNVARCVGVYFQHLPPATAAKPPRVHLESAFQNAVFQAVLFTGHENAITILQSMISSFRPPFPVPETMAALKQQHLVLAGYRMLSDALWLRAVTWQDCVSVIETAVAVLQQNKRTVEELARSGDD